MSDQAGGADADGPSDDAVDNRPAASGAAGDDAAPADASGDPDATDDAPSGPVEWLRWFWTTDSGAAVYARDVITSVVAVLLVGVLLFGVSGIWPPMVAVESPSMEPNMDVGDLVFVVDNERFVPEAAVSHDGQTTGVVPADRAAEVGHSEFNNPGDVIVFRPDGSARRTPIIHRAMLFVEEGENWYDRADPDAVGSADSCAELNNCPAPHAGFITLGDNNDRYDQQTTLSAPVKLEWIVGTAELKVPYLGYVRLAFAGQVALPQEQLPVTGADGVNTSTTSAASIGAAPAADTARPAA